jgi:hypothetical protein
MKAYRGSGGKAPRTVNFGTDGRGQLQGHVALSPWEKTPWLT